MKYSNILKSFAAVACVSMAVATTSCVDYDDNVNFNEANEDMMKVDNLKIGSFFQQMEARVIVLPMGGKLSSDYQINTNLTHDLFSGYAGSTLGNALNHNQYIWVDQWINSTFNDAYTGIMGAWGELNRMATENGNNEVLALANIVKVAGMHRIADSFGPIPYINYGSSNQYDALDKVYAKFFEELDSSIEVLSAYVNAGGASLLEEFDLVYAGNVTNWIKFANTLRLRLALRVVYADEALAQTEAEKSIASPFGLIEVAAERPQIATNENPLYVIAYEFNEGDCRPGASIVTIMDQLGDPRTAAYFKAVNGEYHGVPLGISGDQATYKSACSNYNMTRQSPMVWMAAAESFFLRAEGALRGWNMGDTPQTLYEKGVKTSCDENGVNVGSYLTSDAKLTGYTDNVGSYTYTFSSEVTPAWDDAANFEGKLERIITQKWIATFPNGAEGWAEVRRTGYPELIKIMKNSNTATIDSNLGPRRMPFPLAEKTNNMEGVQSGIAVLGGADNGGTRLWWDQKPL